MLDPRRIVAGLVGLVGLVVLAVSVWLGALVGTDGRVVFTAHADHTVVIGPDSLNRVNGPVTVTAASGSGPVWLGAARPSDLTTALADGTYQQVSRLDFPSRDVDLDLVGNAALPDLTALDIWRGSATSTLEITQDEAPEAVVVVPPAPGEVTVTLTYVSRAWFVEAIVFAIVGLIVIAFGAGWLYQLSAPPKLSRRGHRASPAELAAAEPEAAGPDGERVGEQRSGVPGRTRAESRGPGGTRAARGRRTERAARDRRPRWEDDEDE